MPKSDRPEFAVTAETRLTLRRIFIEFYLENNDFCTELIGLADGFNGPVEDGNVSWWFVKQQAPQWTLRVSQLCEKWGLTFADKAAEQAVHLWCTERRGAGDQCKPGNLINGFHAGSNLPLDDIEPPAADRWDPTWESRASAEARLREAWEAHLEVELDRIEEAHVDLVPTTLERRPNRRPKAEEHLRWLFKHRALRHSFAKIAQGPPMVEQGTVRMACGRRAGEVGLI